MQARVKDSKIISIGQIIGGVVFLIFAGIMFITVATSGDAPFFALAAILLIGLTGGLGSIIYGQANLKSEKGIAHTEIDLPDYKAKGSDFDEKLRKLESLKRDNLISEEEYQKKRSEIMRQNW